MNDLQRKRFIFKIPIDKKSEEYGDTLYERAKVIPFTSSEDKEIRKYFTLLFNIIGIERFRHIIEIGLSVYINNLMK